jgi:outer membrane lipoprotein-sorting protein
MVCAGEPLEAVLARMDKDAATFRSLTAEFKRITYTAVLQDSSQETGKLWIRRSGPHNTLMRIDFAEPNPRVLAFDGTRGQIYYPKIQTVQIYDLGKHRSLVDQFLLLGFGSSGRQLTGGYVLKTAGEEAVAGRRATRLELTPKSSEVLQYVQKVELWIPEDHGYPVQQRFLQPGGDYALITYSDIQLNPNLPDDQVKLSLPAGVKREYPQK